MKNKHFEEAAMLPRREIERKKFLLFKNDGKSPQSSLLNVVFGKFERLLREYVREDDDEEIPGGFEREEDHGGLCDDQVTIERHFGQLERCLRDTKDQGCRIKELEDALRQSVLIVSEREKDFISLEESKGQLSEKVKKLEQRIASLQNAKFLRCKLCQRLTKRLELLNEKFHILLQEKRSRLQELTNIRQEAIELAISEKDARIAQLEVSGAKTQEQIESLDQLRSDRNKLNNRLKSRECSSFEEELSNLFFIEDPTYDDFG
uniref:Uncharacterized protein n=1 Tax=Lutzomyia longipalpis TaxID=7200 RepID=A0A1B0GH39_LUTLO